MGKSLTPFFLIFFVLSGTIWAQKMVEIDSPPEAPGFIGYVEDEFIMVLKEHPGGLDFKVTSDGIVRTGRDDFDALGQRFQVRRIKRQFPNAKKDNSARPTGQKMSRHYKVRFNNGELTEVMRAYRRHPLVEHVEPIGIHSVYVEANDPYYQVSPDPDFPYDQWHKSSYFCLGSRGGLT
ncbi:hypothetical protein ACFL02_03725, partial [Planctomycetota bacterium]